MTTLGAENTCNIKYTLASEDNKVLHDIGIDDMGKHFIESAYEDLATFKMDWPESDVVGLCWGRVTEHPQDNDYFYAVTDETSLNVTSGEVIESLVVDRLPLVGWDCWTNMDTVNNILNMLDDEYTVTIGDYTFNMIDDKAHLAENIEQFKKALSKYGSKRPEYISESTLLPSTSVVFKIKNDIIDYKQVFPIYGTKSDYFYGITEENFLYKLQNIWNRVILGQQSYFDENKLISYMDFNIAISNKLQRETLAIQKYEDNYYFQDDSINGKNDTVIKKIFITTADTIHISGFKSLEYIEQNGNDFYGTNQFFCVRSDDAKVFKYIIPKEFLTDKLDIHYYNPKMEKLIIDRTGGLPNYSSSSNERTLLKTITLLNITEIGDSSFQGLPNNIEKIELPSTLLKIGKNCFIMRRGVNENFSIVVPESVTEIGENSFRNVPKLYYKGTATGAPWGAKEVITEF